MRGSRSWSTENRDRTNVDCEVECEHQPQHESIYVSFIQRIYSRKNKYPPYKQRESTFAYGSVHSSVCMKTGVTKTVED